MSRRYRKGVTYDFRDGFKMKGKDLVLDGERNIWVNKNNADERHPQRFRRPPGPDGTAWQPGIPAPHSIPVEVQVHDETLQRMTMNSGFIAEITIV